MAKIPQHDGYQVVYGTSTGSNAHLVDTWIEYNLSEQYQVNNNIGRILTVYFYGAIKDGNTTSTSHENSLNTTFSVNGIDGVAISGGACDYRTSDIANLYGWAEVEIRCGLAGGTVNVPVTGTATTHSSYISGGTIDTTIQVPFSPAFFTQTNNFFTSTNGKWVHFYTKETQAQYGSYFTCSTDGVPVPAGYSFGYFNEPGWTVTGDKNDGDGNGHFLPIEYDVTQTHYLPGGIGFQNTVDTAFYDTYFTPYTVTPPAGYSTEGATFNYFDAGLNHLGSGTIGQTSFAITGKHFVEVYYTAKTYTVAYDANGGVGSMQESVATYHEEFTTRPNTFERTGYEFIGWNEAPDGSGVAWTLDSTGVYESGKGPWWWGYDYGITLYAQWKPKAEMFAKDGDHYRRGLAKVKHDGKWKEGTLIYKKINGQWKAKN